MATHNLSHLGDLRPDPENRRTHTPRNVGMVVEALQQVGAARSIVIDEDNTVLAGNGVVEAAAEAGITKVRIIDADGSEVVAVRRSGLSEQQKRALALYDNRAAELAEWNPEQLQADAAAGLALEPWFSDAELSRILNTKDDAADHWQGMPEFEQDDQMPFKRLIVNFKSQAAVDAFARLIEQTITNRTPFVWYPAEARARVDEAYVDADA